MKKQSTYFLRFVLTILGLAVLAFCVFALPSMLNGASAEFPYASMAVSSIIVILYATAIPFYIAMWHTFKLLNYIDTNKAFSELSVLALKKIKICAAVISALYIGIVPLLFPIADMDDAPGLLLIGAAIACAPIAVAVFASLLQKLLQNAIDIKSENDLTV